MQIQVIIDNIEEEEQILRDLNVDSLDSSLICLKPSLSISLWIIEYYFTNKSIEMKNIIGSHDMFSIYQMIQPSSSIEFAQLCKNKLNKIKNDQILDNYNNYLSRCGLLDIIDLFHQCQLESFINTIILSIDNIKNHIDRLFFDYLVELSSSYCIYDVKTKITTTETKENLVKLIVNEKKYDEQTISKIYIKHTLCTYLSLLLDTRNEHAFIHCLVTSARNGIERATIVELKQLSKSECLTIYQILLSFIQRKELILNRISSLEQDQINADDESCQILDKYYIDIKEFIDFIEQLQMIIKENEYLKFESTVTFRRILELISKQLHKDLSLDQYDLIIQDIVEEFCQCFQTTLSLMNCSSPIQSAASGSSLVGQRFLRSVAYLCVKQTMDLPIANDSSSTGPQTASYSPIEDNENDQREQLSNKTRYHQCKSHRSLDLSTIHETSFDSDSVPTHSTTSSDKPQPTVKRQPLGEINVNSFTNEERQIENEKNPDKNSFVLTLVSDGDKENLPLKTKKRSMMSTNVEPPCKKQKKTNVIIGQKMITSFFQSTS